MSNKELKRVAMLISSVEVATGTVKLSMEWEVMTGTEFASQQERMFNIECIFSAKRD